MGTDSSELGAAPLALSAAKKQATPISISFHRETGMTIFTPCRIGPLDSTDVYFDLLRLI
jgi:hypothetical protein